MFYFIGNETNNVRVQMYSLITHTNQCLFYFKNVLDFFKNYTLHDECSALRIEQVQFLL